MQKISYFFLLSLGLAGGILIADSFIIDLKWVWFVLVFLLVCMWKLVGMRWFYFFLILAMSCLGYLRTDYFQERKFNAIENYAPSQLVIRGIVETYPEIKQKGKKENVAFILKAEEIIRKKTETGQTRYQRETLRVVGRVQIYLLNPNKIISKGDRIEIYGALKKPNAISNPGEFDFGEYLARRDVYSLMTALGGGAVKILHKSFNQNPFDKTVEFVRNYIDQTIDRIYNGEEPLAPLLKALILGNRKQLDDRLKDDFLKTGTIQLLPTGNRKWAYHSLTGCITSKEFTYLFQTQGS